jgi:hypothetical protein
VARQQNRCVPGGARPSGMHLDRQPAGELIAGQVRAVATLMRSPRQPPAPISATRSSTGRGHAEQSHPPAARLPVPHRLTPPRRSVGPAACRRQVRWMIPGWRPSLSPGPSRVSRHPVVPEPLLEPRRHPGILAGLPLTPCVVNRDQLHCQECPARAACMTDEDASATAIQEDPVRGS